MTNNKFYYVQTAKVVNVLVIKDVSYPRLGIFAHFSNSIFLVIVVNEIRRPTGLELVHI